MEIGQADCRGSEVGNKDLAGNVQTLDYCCLVCFQIVYEYIVMARNEDLHDATG